MKPNKEHKKPRRLESFSYRGYYQYFITIRSYDFKYHFVNDEVVAKIIEILKSTCEQEGFLVWAYCYGVQLWGANYYEHVLRNDEATRAVAQYIIQNPVRKGIVEDCSNYPYSGSFELENIYNL